jgi:hypothetical protein
MNNTHRMLLFVLTGALATPVFAKPAMVSRVQGDVDIREPNSLTWQKVVPGDKVQEGSTLRTASRSSAELKTSRGHLFKVHSDTTFELTSLQDDETKTRLEKGRVISKVSKLHEKESFALQTPTAVCAVRGTEFDTIASEKGTLVSVFEGVVGVAALGTQRETAIPAGQMTSIHDGTIEVPHPIPQNGSGSSLSGLAREARHEVGLDMTRNEVIAAAVLEQRRAEYVEGKTMIDVSGRRVRLEEYIVRTRPDQFKFVALNHRDNRLDYFYYQGTFNKNLPTDLSVALRDLSGKLGTNAPEYYLTDYEMGQSNTQDQLKDTSSGGHLVKIEMNSDGSYLLTDSADPTHTRTVQGSELQGDGTYKIYNPIGDNFTIVDAANKDVANKFGVYLPENDSFHNLSTGDTYWKARFNSYSHELNHATKISYTPTAATNVLASALDATWTYAGGFVLPVVQTDPKNLDTTITNYYGDGTFERYRTVLIDDMGSIAPLSAFSGISTGAAYKGELLKWNYEQQVEASEFEGRKIDLVVEPKIFIKSGLIQ